MKKSINQILDNNKNYVKIYFLPALIILSFLLRVIVVYFTRDTHLDNEWNNLLNNLIEHKSFVYYTFDGILIPSALVPPMYPIFMYLINIINPFGTVNLLHLIIAVQLLISTYSVFLFYQINQNFFSQKVSLINAVIFSIIPLNVIISGQISSITLQMFLSLLFLKFLFHIINKENNKNIFIFSLISGLLILTRGEFLIIFSFILFFILIKKKIKLINLIKTLIIVILILSPYIVRNYIHFNEIFIVKSFGYNLWKGNNEFSTIEGYENLEKIKFKELKNKINNLKKDKYYEINRDNVFLDEAVKNINEDPVRYLGLFVKKFFSYYFIDLNSNYPNYYNFFHIIPILLLSIMSLPGLFVFFKKNKFESKCLGFYLFLNLIIFSIFFILPRYKLAILPIQIILMSYFISYLIKRFKKN